MNSLEKKALSGVGKFLLALLVMLLLPAWTVNFWQAWIYWVIFSLSVIIITLYFLKHDPKLIERRIEVGPKAEKEQSQKTIQSITGVIFMLLILFPGIDHQLHWSYVPFQFEIISDILVATGFLIISLVFKENSYTASIVDVWKEQKVISTGPYGIVRHPMYSGALLLFIFTPIALGSWWGLLIGFLLCIMLCVRLLDEEKFLIKNLNGYKEYSKKTRYHLIPGMW